MYLSKVIVYTEYLIKLMLILIELGLQIIFNHANYPVEEHCDWLKK